MGQNSYASPMTHQQSEEQGLKLEEDTVDDERLKDLHISSKFLTSERVPTILAQNL